MRIVLRVLAVVVAVVLAGCGDEDGPVASDGNGAGADGGSIQGAYVATGVEEDGEPRELVEGTTVRVRFADGRLTASAGCNTIGGDHTIEDGVLRVSAVSMTEMGCDPARHAQDDWLAGVLSDSPALDRHEQGFVLRTATTTITFVEESVVDPDRPLVGTTWVVDGYVDGTGPDGTASSAPGDTARVVLEDNGFVTGHDGCNGFGYGGEVDTEPTDGLRYDVTGDRITFSGAAVTTDIACPDVDTERFWSVLSGSASWDVDGSRLTLTADDGRGVTYRAEP